MQRALQKDLATVLDKLKVRCPVTAMVVGLEEESGFRELVRRVGRARAVGQRFGKGFSIGNPPLPERLEALAAHACGAFEDWVYTLFREKDALSKPGNTKLFGLLCKIRRNVQSRLANILVAGFAAGEAAGRPAENFLFSGCYFAATGDTEDRQAFVQGVFDKLPAAAGRPAMDRRRLPRRRPAPMVRAARLRPGYGHVAGAGRPDRLQMVSVLAIVLLRKVGGKRGTRWPVYRRIYRTCNYWGGK